MIDFIIVGNGLAGICFAEWALKNNKKIFVYENNSISSSKVAAGLYNPVVLKRFSEIWKAKEQIQLAFPFYRELEQKLKIKIDFSLPLFRKFASIEEQNNWFQAADKITLKDFLNTNLVSQINIAIPSKYSFGEVFFTGFLDVSLLLKSYTSYLEVLNCYSNESFIHDSIVFEQDYILYNNIKTKHIVFAEGFGMHFNPFFSNLPLDGTKGELLIIKAPNLNLNAIVKSNIFIFPIGNDLYKVGATYNWQDKDAKPTEIAKDELLINLKELINCDFEIVNHLAGVRPTVKDRRPLVGQHFKYKNLHVLNGLGTRGVMLGPFLAKQLYENITLGNDLDAEIDIKRVYKKLNLT